MWSNGSVPSDPDLAPDRSDPATVLHLLERRARDEPERIAFTFGGSRYGFGDVARGLRSVASRLLRRGAAPGDRVLVLLPNGPGFFAAFYGAQRAGAVPVPLFAESGSERVRDLAAACGVRFVALPAESTAGVADRLESQGLEVLVVAEDLGGVLERPEPSRWPPVEADDTAFLQYTSGSTGEPKGVVIRHAELVVNVRQMIAGMEITERDVFVSWLPVHHDMGLILMTMVPFWVGAELHLLPSRLTEVRPWLAAVAEHGGTFTAAPDFAWRLCLRAVRDASQYDLSSLRVALNAAEPVRPQTLRRFHETFGLDRVMVPGYGLAEATVGVSMQPPGSAPAVSERGFVALGRPFPGIAVHVVRSGLESGAGDGGSARTEEAPAAPGEVGEIVVESPANTRGYFRDPQATEALFWRPGCIRTGDLGYRSRDGELFLVGRSKNIILQAGRNLAPQEIEAAVEALPFVRRAAAVGVDRGDAAGEQAHVFVELRRAAPPPEEAMQEWVVQVVESVHRRLGLRPGRVLLVRPRTIPLTPNGKVRHAALRTAWEEGGVDEAAVLFP